ncbi:AAA family ATPase [Gulosibacter sediminis]|uniref:AAA family ATPase n=1 Tax=Gulosibacter sediminis TaxID=1729695 RepID=UPI0024A8C4CC|nr:AAA family ATPase [Gulosibacter sediminis]
MSSTAHTLAPTFVTVDDVTRPYMLAKHVGPVFPCRPRDGWEDGKLRKAKSPYPVNGFYAATRDPKQIGAWQREHEGCLWGVWAGAASLVVLDVDMGGDKDGWASLDEAGLTPPDTFVQTTMNGGDHYIYTAPEGAVLAPNSPHVTPAGEVLDDVDRRAGNSYFIWYSDQVPTSRDAFAPAPEWLCTPSSSSSEGTSSDEAVSAWLARIGQQQPHELHSLETKVSELEGREFGHDDMNRAVAAIVRTSSLADTPYNVTPYLERLHAAYTRPPWNTDHYRHDFDASLAGAVRKYSSTPPRLELVGLTPRQDTMTTAEPIRLESRDDVTEQPARLVLTKASTVTMQRQRWLWHGRIPADTPSIFAGRGGEGKTTYALDLAAQLTRGELPGEHEGTPADVLVWSGEDRAETVLLPRLTAAGADLERVHIVTSVQQGDETIDTPRFPEHIEALEAAVSATSAALVILDPLTSTTGGDLHKVADVRRTLDALAGVTHRTGAVVLGIMHFNKGQGHAGDKLSGSHAFRDAVRSLFLFASDDEAGHRIVTQEKNNYAENIAPSLAYNLVSTTVPLEDGNTVEVARVQHLGESDVSVQDLIDRQREDAEQRQERSEAEAFLVDYLRGTEAFEAPAGDVLKAARASGFSDQQTKDARRRCKHPRISSTKSTFGSGWVWSLEGGDAEHHPNEGTPEGGTEISQGGEGGKVADPRESATIAPPTPQGGEDGTEDQGLATLPPSPPSTDPVPPSAAILDAFRRAGGDPNSIALEAGDAS